MNDIILAYIASYTLERAYIIGKRLRNLHIHYIWYTSDLNIDRDRKKTMTYMETLMEEYRDRMTWALWQWDLSCWVFRSSKTRIDMENKRIWVTNLVRELAPQSDDIANKRYAYESVGIIPRSITRTLMRFQSELISRSRSLLLAEFRLLKYQAIASLESLIVFCLVSWIASSISRWILFKPLISAYWQRMDGSLFVNTTQETEALQDFQLLADKIWLEGIFNPGEASNLHDVTSDLLEQYTTGSIEIIFTTVNSLWLLICWASLIRISAKRLAIVNSWLQELFYSLSDTMKAFWILLATDLCIGFHSPHGWELAIAGSVDYLGLAPNPYLVSCIVSTLPVIIDTIFKYWIFRHLNRISPSIVVTYHTMNE